MKTKRNKTKFEFSKLLCLGVSVIFSLVAIYCIIDYYILIRYSIINESSIVPDASLPITAITGIIATVLSYCLYQGFLKNSLNKNKLKINESGQIEPIMENLMEDNQED